MSVQGGEKKSKALFHRRRIVLTCGGMSPPRDDVSKLACYAYQVPGSDPALICDGGCQSILVEGVCIKAGEEGPVLFGPRSVTG